MFPQYVTTLGQILGTNADLFMLLLPN